MSAKMNSYGLQLTLLFVLGIIELCSCSPKISQVTINPNCGQYCESSNVTTVYLRTESSTDSLHYVWDFSGKPSVLLAVTIPSAQLEVDWKKFLWGKEESLKFTEAPSYTFGITVLKIYEFNDVNDTGYMDNVRPENINVLHPKHFRWDRKSYSQNNDYFELSMEGTDYKFGSIQRNGTIKVLLNRFWKLDHSDIMPHMLHTENATQIDIIIDNFQTNSSFNNSRFAVELLIIADHNLNSTMKIDVKKTLDDEHTPGIFEMVEITTPVCDVVNREEMCDKRIGEGYLQWRPVSYTDAQRDVTNSTEAIHYPLTPVANHAQSANNSLLYSYYGYNIENLLMQKVVVSLGSKGDGFYKKSNYSTWTFTIGYGNPPAEKFSLLVIMIISIGLGLPVVIMVAVGIYVCVRRRCTRSDTLSLNS
ncbi:glycosylated lysosomal membrane protein-like [Neodiprion virginianus]|uniref:glycosylated lysosomal membrane protein-like n=1 Tax=Neodiprion virginianus TaxID=2961670 RepID=UPI001EE6A591|nr:glycosylated lysosomal membrane protein-like [Neodiprion virginianus]